jgi:hypothetical protein
MLRIGHRLRTTGKSSCTLAWGGSKSQTGRVVDPSVKAQAP